MLDTAIVTDNKFFHDYINSTFCNTDDPLLKEYNIMCKSIEIEDISVDNPEIKLHAIIHLNIHSLPAKHQQLELIIQNMNNKNIQIDFILLCETFLKK